MNSEERDFNGTAHGDLLDQQPIPLRTEQRFTLRNIIFTVVISLVSPLVIFGVGYLVYGQNELRKLEAEIESSVQQRVSAEIAQNLAKSQRDVAELEKIIKAIDAKYASEIKEIQIQAKQAEIESSVVNSQLSSIQSQILEIDLESKKIQKTLEVKRDETSTAMLVADFMTKVIPTAQTNCDSEFKSQTRYYIFCNITNVGHYPFVVNIGVRDNIEESVFVVDGQMNPSGLVQPGQRIGGSITLVFNEEFSKRSPKNYKLVYMINLETTKNIVETLIKGTKNKKDKQKMSEAAIFVSNIWFDVNFR